MYNLVNFLAEDTSLLQPCTSSLQPCTRLAISDYTSSRFMCGRDFAPNSNLTVVVLSCLCVAQAKKGVPRECEQIE